MTTEPGTISRAQIYNLIAAGELETEKILHRVEDAAELLSVSRATIYKLIAGGELEAVKLGARTLIHRTSLERFADRLLADATGDRDPASNVRRLRATDPTRRQRHV